jgi:uncharacterized linocin/CFP29 family protein
LQRDQAPLSGDEWAALDTAVVRTARGSLVGRRFLTVVGPFGAGVEVVPHDTIGSPGPGKVDLLGDDEEGAIGSAQRTFRPLPLVYQDFRLHWRDLASSRQFGLPLDTGKAVRSRSPSSETPTPDC